MESSIIVGQKERETQNRLIGLFKNKDKLDYTYLGNFEKRENNSNVEEELLQKYLKDKYSQSLINKAIFEIKKVSDDRTKALYDCNKEFYEYLRYGVKIKELGQNAETIHLIDWKNPQKNDFYIAEEVTINGQNQKRPDIVIYVNGIALGVLELKRSKISVSEGIRQNLDNQKPIFIKHFFNTIQFVMAGNDTEGLRYGTIETPEKYYLTWKEDSEVKNILDRDILQLCQKNRFLELIHDFIVYDKGTKKLCRHNQYFGVKATQDCLKKREGGIIWHTQGSGKSLTMVWLAKWILENRDDSRILIITDRDELDEQIEKVFVGVGEKDIHRTKSSKDMLKQLNTKKPRIICSLIHKFKSKEDETGDIDDYIKELKSNLPKDFEAKGDIHVFVDECHRTQSGKLHSAMKEIILNSIFIGFTGTPLLKKDKQTSLEVFGKYIHTYKFNEAVKDKVILDLRYEARDIDQKITSQERIDKWFEAKTSGLTEYAKIQLKKKWITMQKVLSSKDRLNKIVADIVFDFETKDRLQNGKGNAILVAGSVYQACKYYEIFQSTTLKKCAIITSYDESISGIKGETIGNDEDTENIFKNEVYQKMIKHYEELYPQINTLGFEVVIKDKFIYEPAQMKLLIVVDKLLTGFDAPSATYLYIDKSMKDHGLFQAICRVNRLDGEDKEYGYIIDYKDLFKKIENSIEDYTSEALGGYNKKDVQGLLTDRLKLGKEKLDDTLESMQCLCEGVKSPKDSLSYIHYFCGESKSVDELKSNEPKRVELYKTTSALIRAYSNIANEMKEAGYTKAEIEKIKIEIKHYSDVRDEIKYASGDYIDLKAYEPAMRHLIDSYISAEESQKLSAFDDLTLLEMITKKGVNETIKTLPNSINKKKEAVAETIENNLRKLIIEKQPINPKYYENISKLLEELVKKRKAEAIKYEEYLKQIEKITKESSMNSVNIKNYPQSINSKAKMAFYDNLAREEGLALTLDKIVKTTKRDGWRDNKLKEREIKLAIGKVLSDETEVEKVFNLIKNQEEY